MKKLIPICAIVFSSFNLFSQQSSADPNDPLYKGFVTPPAEAKPRVWWHWMNGNITKDGISKDLHWMQRAGIGGFQNFDAGMTTPQIVTKRLSFMTPEWKDAFKFTAQVADSLKLEMAIAGSPGWSESGGPWVPAKDGMKKLVWTEAHVSGGQSLNEKITKPSPVTGLFQNIPLDDPMAGLLGKTPQPPEFYQDISVVAYKVPEADIPMSVLKPKVSSSDGSFTIEQLSDGDLAKTAMLPSTTDNSKAWIQFAFDKPQEIKSLTIVGGGIIGFFSSFGPNADTRVLEASDDGQTFRLVQSIPSSVSPEVTINITPTTAKYFRVGFKNPPMPMDVGAMLGTPGPKPEAPKGNPIAEVALHTVFREHRVEDKAGFTTMAGLRTLVTAPSTDVIDTENIIDLTSKMNADGQLTWTAPAGNWTIVRFGYSLTGKQNHPASFEATGLEVDKLDPLAVKSYFNKYLDQYKNATAGWMGKKGLQFMVTDSWEAGAENWTPKMREEFMKRRGYDMLPWMPVLTGQIVRSSEASDRFLWDFRKTISELTAQSHYDQLTTLLKERGMKRYTESHETGRAIQADGMDVKRLAAVPMSAIWTPNPMMSSDTRHRADIRESASVAHIYGQNLAAAESLTAIGSAFSFSPEKLKPTADIALSSGLNRFVIHTSVHQPVDDKIPGLGLGPFGQWFTRHETWAEQAKAWTAYLSRSCYMLQQGKFVADVIYYYGEDNNITALFGDKLPDVPRGYNYDFTNAHALLNELSVKDGKLITKTGMSYRILALDSNATQMTMAILKKIKDLVTAGAVVVGPKPVSTPALQDKPEEFTALVNELWGAGSEAKSTGKGKVYSSMTISAALQDLKVIPDFSAEGANLVYVHRQLPAADLYWVSNPKDSAQDIDVSFRVTDRNVEIWHPETARTEPASYAIGDGATKVSLHLVPNDAIFVVFKGKPTSAIRSLPAPVVSELTTVEGEWQVAFQKDRGAPASISMNELGSWTENENPGVKYFSGTADYKKTIDVSEDWMKGSGSIWLDLGDVKNLAEVVVNGQSMGIVWKKPFRVEVTKALKTGKNTLDIKVTNLWVNRLIGDAQPGVEKKITYTALPFYQADGTLLPSGLMGPVKMLSLTSK